MISAGNKEGAFIDMIRYVFAVLLALFYSVVYTVIGPMIANQVISFEQVRILPFAVCFIICLAVNFLIFFIMPRLYLRAENGRISKCLNSFFEKVGDRRLFLLVWAFLFVSWVPAYLIFYPGVLSYDMINQTKSALGGITDNHHPVLHTWLIGLFMKLGDSLLGDYESGLGILSLLQMFILSYALTRLIFLLKKRKVPALMLIFTAFLSAIWFENACLSVTMIKDILHAAFLVLFACHFMEIALNPSEYSLRKHNLFIFPVVSFLMCAFRNNGIHIYLFCFAVLLVLRIHRIKKAKAYIPLIAAILLPVFMFKIYTGPVFEAFGIAQGESREALSVPIQQLQRVTVRRAEELTGEQMERMEYYIANTPEWLEPAPGRAYDPFCADPAKTSFHSGHYDEDPIAFWKFYLQTGAQFPELYAVAFLSNTLGYWYPGYYEFSYVMYDNYPPEVFAEPLERKSIWNPQVLQKYYESACGSDFWRETPVLRLFFVPGFALWFLLYAIALAWKKRGFFTKVLPLFLPLIAQYGIMLLSPMSSFRYSWPFYLMLPLVFAGICGNFEPVRNSSDKY